MMGLSIGSYLSYCHLYVHKVLKKVNNEKLPELLVVPLLDGRGILKLLENVLVFLIVPEYSLSTNEVFVMARDLVPFDSVVLLLMLEFLLSKTCFPAVPFTWF